MEIKIQFSYDGIFGDNTDGILGVATRASVEQYAETLRDELHKNYPNASIEIEHGITDRHTVDGRGDSDIAAEIGEIVHDHWSEMDWVVYDAARAVRMDDGATGSFVAETWYGWVNQPPEKFIADAADIEEAVKNYVESLDIEAPEIIIDNSGNRYNFADILVAYLDDEYPLIPLNTG